ncbi:AAA domain-containing protein [Niveispirillum sp. SYP-B3756]|uniref:AAA family ATPase n=1 Tax=Niveispirillum sp. SYP-B3756 TaxID=2662178 RepID=UPI001292A6A4|nr:MoxR family ATPase [Niveispirillum sp. SYP-B3756]MQP68603.1 AAA domain-containing protein [Niveispirillum sp. SYP-B3756]
MMQFLTTHPGQPLTLAPLGSQPEQVHVFDQDSIYAINAALAARRPLLVLGEPGTGKSQLALAAASALRRAFVQKVVTARTEAQDLVWHFDAVSRLAEAQLAGALKSEENHTQVRERLAVENFLTPGPLWWALNWGCAKTQAEKAKSPPPHQPPGCDPANGCVVLIDEIDKAEPELPNGLLEVLGNGEFTPTGWDKPVKSADTPPLIIITSNEERALPAAFQRRCLALRLTLPTQRDALIAHLIARGQAHFPNASADMLARAAAQLADDRQAAAGDIARPKPGQAEYLDLVRAIITLAPDAPEEQVRLIEQIAPFVMKTHRGEG